MLLDRTPIHPTLVFDRAHPEGIDQLDGIGWIVAGDLGTSGRNAADRNAKEGTHPNGITATDHVVVMAPDLDRVRRAVVGAGLHIRRERSTKMADTPVTQLFAVAGGVLIEVVAPAEPNGDGASTVWGLAFASADLNATVEWFGTRISQPRGAVQTGRRIASVRHADLGISLPIAVMDVR